MSNEHDTTLPTFGALSRRANSARSAHRVAFALAVAAGCIGTASTARAAGDGGAGDAEAGDASASDAQAADAGAGDAQVADAGAAEAGPGVASAEFFTADSYSYGRFEARLMFPAGDGVVGSFFLWKNGSEQAGTFWNELDYEKINANCTLQINANYGSPVTQHQTLPKGLTTLCSGYHTYAYEWTPDYIAWSIDGVELRRDTGPTTTTAKAFADNASTDGMQFRFNIWPGDYTWGGNFSTSELPVQEYVSWVQYSKYTPGTGDVACNFTLAWRESFDQGVPDSWSEGNWASPKNHSIDAPANVTASNGIAVLSLTLDTMTGFTGTPPADDGDLPSVQGPSDAATAAACDGGAHAGDSGTGSGGSTGNSSGSGSGNSAPHASSDSGGCTVTAVGTGGVAGAFGTAALAIVAAFGRRRAARRNRKGA